MFDPSTLGDPLALQTSWTPLKPGGANFTTHALHDHPEGLEYRKNARLFAFGALFLLLGVGVSIGASRGEWWLLFIGLPFVGIGGWVVWPTKVLFDRARASVTLQGRVVPFSTIVALQLLTERDDLGRLRALVGCKAWDASR